MQEVFLNYRSLEHIYPVSIVFKDERYSEQDEFKLVKDDEPFWTLDVLDNNTFDWVAIETNIPYINVDILKYRLQTAKTK